MEKACSDRPAVRVWGHSLADSQGSKGQHVAGGLWQVDTEVIRSQVCRVDLLPQGFTVCLFYLLCLHFETLKYLNDTISGINSHTICNVTLVIFFPQFLLRETIIWR